MLNRINNLFPDLKPTDPIQEEFYNKLMTNIVEIFIGTDCIDQMLQRLGKIDKKRITLIAHNASGFDNWIMIRNVKKLTQCPLKTTRGILSLPLTNSFTDEDLQKKWKRQKEIKGNSNYLQNINFICSYQHESSSLAAWGNSSNLPMNLRKIGDVNIAKYTKDNWESLRHEWEPYAKRDTLCLGACLIKYNQVMKEVVFQNISNSQATLKANYDSHVKSYEKVNDSQYIVEINEEEKEFIPPKSTRLTPSHLGSFVLSHSKKIMNNFIHVIDGFYKPEIYYTDTDSLYIASSNRDKLNEAGAKVKYNIILTSDGFLKAKKTFKGYSKDKISVEDYIRLASGLDVTNEFKKPWVKSSTNGVVIPKDDDKQKRVFRSYLNLVKRKAPNSEGIIYPYNDGKELNMDENYEFDDHDYLTIQEENEEC
ncbi:hypothetical protein LOTGIDRAFT_158419 [Lottia gigantea]|uniref:DNA-directed DNA polymerase n=1 Tax=Lottia gigantea TaxID=225164 RepID=V4A619_LOTGI|nr:hypothetical protein LOTGIDRAFT_158419 [Lottia gigantea]ESO99333.1 hypothetical protein LOTGIDRAFT_158419 [Lottia gigantea]